MVNHDPLVIVRADRHLEPPSRGEQIRVALEEYYQKKEAVEDELSILEDFLSAAKYITPDAAASAREPYERYLSSLHYEIDLLEGM